MAIKISGQCSLVDVLASQGKCKRTIILFPLLLFFCGLCKGKQVLSHSKVSDLPLGNAIATNYMSIPEFRPKLNLNLNTDITYSSGYEPTYSSGYASNDEPTPPIPPLCKPEETNVSFDLKKEIEEMRKEADKSRGCTWQLSGDKLTRVVGNSCNSLYAIEDYVVIGLNIYRAAKKVCELYKKNESEIVDDASRFLHYYKDEFERYHDYEKNQKAAEEAHWIQTIKNINEAVVLYLQNNLFPGVALDIINKQLRLAENYVGLEDTHYDVTTVFKIKGKEFELEDKKSFPLTEKQKEKIRNRASEHWFKRLDEFEKKLFNAYVDKFLDDKHYTPTQLRDIIGCRNAYEKKVWYYDQNHKILLGHYFHSGSLASPYAREDEESRAADWEITQQNWEQVRQKFNNMVWLSLNRNMGGQNIPFLKKLSEKKIVEDTRKAVGPDQFMNFSINELATKPIFKDLVRTLPSNLPGSSESLVHNKEVEDSKNKKYCKSHERLNKAAEQFDASNLWKQNTTLNDNCFANLAADCALCKMLLGEHIGISCKSGKDRTGMMSSWIDSKIIRAHYPDLDQKNSPVYKYLAYSGHYQLLASINGGMPGRFGMKNVRPL
ncbi:inositol phosphate phosphatase SopB [Cardinium endosymbiont of Philonthus spinipes]|uniref:inositol phosphate phosphatase SopB n=1 Tax=Cardinium endosymbiont of Philonthus spinipes TaxID=3077941 RepID=UPI00313E02B0